MEYYLKEFIFNRLAQKQINENTNDNNVLATCFDIDDKTIIVQPKLYSKSTISLSPFKFIIDILSCYIETNKLYKFGRTTNSINSNFPQYVTFNSQMYR